MIVQTLFVVKTFETMDSDTAIYQYDLIFP